MWLLSVFLSACTFAAAAHCCRPIRDPKWRAIATWVLHLVVHLAAFAAHVAKNGAMR